jgi:predicted Fe-Mo cluster-binding NifX family protein
MSKDESKNQDRSDCRVAVTSKGDSIDSEIGSIGTSTYFIIFESKIDNFSAIRNEAMGQGSDAGVRAAELLKSKGAGVIITSNIGKKGLQAFEKAGITVHSGCTGKVRESIQKCAKGELPECKGVTYVGPMKW